MKQNRFRRRCVRNAGTLATSAFLALPVPVQRAAAGWSPSTGEQKKKWVYIIAAIAVVLLAAWAVSYFLKPRNGDRPPQPPAHGFGPPADPRLPSEPTQTPDDRLSDGGNDGSDPGDGPDGE